MADAEGVDSRRGGVDQDLFAEVRDERNRNPKPVEQHTRKLLEAPHDLTEIKLDPQTFFADTTLALRDDIQLPDDSAALVSSEGLMGGSFVELVPGGSLETLAAGDEILDTQGAVSVLALMMKFAGGNSQEGQQ